MGTPGKPYRPSNGTEGDIFECKFCSHCIHEKYIHTGETSDKQCEVLIGMLLYDSDEKDYPKEVVYDESGKPTCKAYVYWDWGRNDDDNGLNEPPIIEPDDPMQMCLPFELMEMEFNKKQESKIVCQK